MIEPMIKIKNAHWEYVVETDIIYRDTQYQLYLLAISTPIAGSRFTSGQ